MFTDTEYVQDQNISVAEDELEEGGLPIGTEYRFVWAWRRKLASIRWF